MARSPTEPSGASIQTERQSGGSNSITNNYGATTHNHAPFSRVTVRRLYLRFAVGTLAVAGVGGYLWLSQPKGSDVPPTAGAGSIVTVDQKGGSNTVNNK